MSNVIFTGDTSGTLNLAAPLVAGTNTQTLVAATGTLAPLISGTAVSASGTSVDFTGIPSWVKRITVMISGVSVSGSSSPLVQLGSGSITTTGYLGGGQYGTNYPSFSSGFIINQNITASSNTIAHVTLTLVSGNTWLGSSISNISIGANTMQFGVGSIALGGTLDRVRITTVNGTDTFDAGTINILYE